MILQLRLSCFLLISVITMSGFGQAQTDPRNAHTLTGDVRAHKNFHSRFLSKDRDVLVYLPPGYNEARKRYPVLYLQDGQNLFDGATAYVAGNEWRVDETAEELILAGRIEPLIIVGIYNTGEQRVHEYTPTRDIKWKVGGRADLYGQMLVEELKPFIDSQYRTLKTARNTGLGGSSLGGLVSLYLGLKYPDVFGKLAVVSPSLWWGDRFMMRCADLLRKKTSQHIWIDMGTREGAGDDAIKAVKDVGMLRDTLKAKGWVEGKDLKLVVAEGAGHNETAWAGRVGEILRFLFPARAR